MIAATVHTCSGSPLLQAQEASEARDMSVPQVHRGAQSRGARPERFAPLPEDQRRFTSKQILQALSDIIQRDDCFADYQGWVDFGRRSTD
ncbi:gastrin/cholecystokinin-like peptide [Clarias magur]|uniref:Gastrin/cholecystokinin-like peptide n=1 Tax=Clarias magur TaxID=1594786 RepID=A0A8J5C8Z8_CLAMG|nr:gastrin/cholecystokinin-like peptide [Clarias magur]